LILPSDCCLAVMNLHRLSNGTMSVPGLRFPILPGIGPDIGCHTSPAVAMIHLVSFSVVGPKFRQFGLRKSGDLSSGGKASPPDAT